MLSTPGMPFWAYRSKCIGESYAKKHGYGFLHSNCVLDTYRPARWSKIRFIQQHLHHWDWVFWMDADCFIMEPETKLEMFIDPEMDFIVPSHKGKFNTGTFLIRNCEAMTTFLKQVWDCEEYESEQAAFWHVYYDQQIVDAKLKIVPTRTFGALPCKGDEGYQPGDFLVHCPTFWRNRISEFLPVAMKRNS